MKFHIAVNLERVDPDVDMVAMCEHTLGMVQMVDEAGFEIAWAAEHHALEMTIAPNPFHLTTWWADHTKQIGVGAGVANAAYRHPIELANAPAEDEIIVALGASVGGRPNHRIGDRNENLDEMDRDVENPAGV